MTRDYVSASYPAGVWLGSGLAGVNDSAGLAVGSSVSEEHMALLFGAGRDPTSGAPLGREYPTVLHRIASEVSQLPVDLSPDVRGATIAAIIATEKARDTRGAVAGFDLTFSPKGAASVNFSNWKATVLSGTVGVALRLPEMLVVFLRESGWNQAPHRRATRLPNRM